METLIILIKVICQVVISRRLVAASWQVNKLYEYTQLQQSCLKKPTCIRLSNTEKNLEIYTV